MLLPPAGGVSQLNSDPAPTARSRRQLSVDRRNRHKGVGNAGARSASRRNWSSVGPKSCRRCEPLSFMSTRSAVMLGRVPGMTLSGSTLASAAAAGDHLFVAPALQCLYGSLRVSALRS